MTKYFLIYDTILVKGEDSGYSLVTDAFRYQDGQWKSINENEINDRIMGYDPTEDSPMYGIGNSEIMKEIHEITEDEAKIILASH